MEVDLRNRELAEYLAEYLTDLEFELLVRARINNGFHNVHKNDPDLYDGQNHCSYQHSFSDKGTWRVRIGETYSKSVDSEGEVLSTTILNAALQMNMRRRNSLSMLLPAPSPAPAIE